MPAKAGISIPPFLAEKRIPASAGNGGNGSIIRLSDLAVLARRHEKAHGSERHKERPPPRFVPSGMKSKIPLRRLAWAGGTLLLLVIAAALVLAMFPYGWFKPMLEAKLSQRSGTRVTIARIERLDRFSFSPEVAIEGVRVPQPLWAGPGDLMSVRSARLRVPVLLLLLGRFRPSAIAVSGLHLSLVRAADGRKNWDRHPTEGGRGGGGLGLESLRIADSDISYRDFKRHRSFRAAMTSDPEAGVRLAGTGLILGRPVTLAARGAPVAATGRPWPFRILIDGPAVRVVAAGTMDSPLDTSRMSLDATARADDLTTLDALIEAGLFHTRKVDFKAHARHDGEDWTITGLSGSIGGSRIAGDATVRKRKGRTRLDGAVTSDRLAFSDLSSDEGLASEAALQRRIGKRIVPDTRVDLAKMGHLDGSMDVRVAHVVGSAPIASISGRLDLDHSLLRATGLRIGLGRGQAAGSVTVDQRGRAMPEVTIDLRLTGATLATLFGDGPVSGRLGARIHLTGPGRTIREAVARSHGMVGLAAGDGSLPARLASRLGFDIGRAITSGRDEQAGLRCLILRLDVSGGLGRADPLLLDTSRAQTRGVGTVNLATEQIAISLTGAPKKASLLRFPGSVSLAGSIGSPKVTLPPSSKSVGTILKVLGRAITGRQGPTATDADCRALASRALQP
jgi:uncharacterized protein involved in outer membrane biogenesis